jgi:hypothetical protein
MQMRMADAGKIVWPNTALACTSLLVGRGEDFLSSSTSLPQCWGWEAKQGSYAGVCLRTRTVLSMLQGLKGGLGLHRLLHYTITPRHRCEI